MLTFAHKPALPKRLLIFPLFLLLAACAQAHGQLIVIANPNVASSHVSSQILYEIFTGASSSLPGNSLVSPVLQKQGKTQEQFLLQYIRKSDEAYRASWRNLVFTGEAVMPSTLDSDLAIVAYVARTPGALGYIDRKTPHERVKVLTVQ